MKPYDIAVVGSGMGGSMIAALNQDKNTVVFEKDANLGGCAGTFKRKGNLFNVGATTFVGYEQGHPVKEVFQHAQVTPNLRKSTTAIRIIQNNKIIDRVQDFEAFLENINHIYPNKNNRLFWNKIKEVDEQFWQFEDLYYGKYSLESYMKTASCAMRLFLVFQWDMLKSAQGFITETLGDISEEYQSFIDAQLLITLQATSKEISLLSMCLGLAYPFHEIFYVNGGMGSLMKGLLEHVSVKRKENIVKILQEKEMFRLISNKGEYVSKKVILNASVYDSAPLFEDKKIQKYYNQFEFYDQSAFVIHCNLEKKFNLLHHYQIILDQTIPNGISNTFFVSISDKEDSVMSENAYSLTISTHTKAMFWTTLNKKEYEEQKQMTQDFILNEFLKHFASIKKEDIIHISCGTSKTFKRYIRRYNCGGRALSVRNIWDTPCSKTPFNGLYNVGDTVFAGQGWPGVAIGVKILNKELNG
jgi:phytoene dehydrogenase-like protein